MSEAAPFSGEHVVIGDPLYRKDGRLLRLLQTPDDVRVETGGTSVSYTHDEVRHIGGGDWDGGVERIRHAERHSQPQPGEFKAFYAEIEQARQNGLL